MTDNVKEGAPPSQPRYPAPVSLQMESAPVHPDSYMGLSLCALLCCCWPIGLFAVINAMQVDQAYNRGNYQEAEQKSQSARKLSRISIVCGIIMYVIVAIIVGVAVALQWNNVKNSENDPAN